MKDVQSTDLKAHAKACSGLADKILALRESALSCGFEDASWRLLQAANRLRSQHFKVLVIGEFSRGKSTFINALLGQRLLASGLRPTTPVITIISKGEPGSCTVRYRDGHTEQPTAPDLVAILAGKAKGSERIETVELGCANSLLEHGVQIVDTPGVNDVNRLREDVTLRYLPEADAAIFLIDAKAPLNSTEKLFLEGQVLRQNIDHVFFVINKADQLSPPYNAEDLSKILKRVEELVGDRIPETRVFALAAKPALEASLAGDATAREASRLPILEHALESFLARDRGAAVLQRVARDCSTVVGSLNSGAHLEIESLHLSVVDADAKSAAVTAELDSVRQKLDASKARWIDAIGGIQTNVVSRIQAQAAEGVNAVLKTLENHAPESYFNRDGEIRAAAEGQLREIFTRSVYIAKEIIGEELRSEGERLLQQTDEIGQNGIGHRLRMPSLRVDRSVPLHYPSTPMSSPVSGRSLGVGVVGMVAASLVMGPFGAVVIGLLAGWGQSAWTMSGEKSKATVIKQVRKAAQHGLDQLDQGLEKSVNESAEKMWNATTEPLRANVDSLSSSALRLAGNSRKAIEFRTSRQSDLQQLRANAEALLASVSDVVKVN